MAAQNDKPNFFRLRDNEERAVAYTTENRAGVPDFSTEIMSLKSTVLEKRFAHWIPRSAQW
jgi:hypothetical protein